jgi:hypothetical protein
MHLLLPSQIPIPCLNVGRSSSKAKAFGAKDHALQEHLVHKTSFFGKYTNDSLETDVFSFSHQGKRVSHMTNINVIY